MRVDREQRRRRDAVRWLVVVLLLLLALLGLYYYLTRYRVALPPGARPKGKPAAPGKPDQTSKEKRGAAGAESSSTNADGGGGGAKGSRGGGGKAKKGSQAGKGSRPPASQQQQPPAGAGARRRPKEEPKQRKSSTVEEVDLSSVRLLRRPISPSDPDRPHIIEILSADNLLEADRFNDAIEKFNEILKRFPQSPRALLGKAQALEGLSRAKKSNKLLDTAIEFYEKASTEVTSNDDIKTAAFSLLAGAAEARGRREVEIRALEKLYKLKEEAPAYAVRLGLAHLRQEAPKKAKPYFRKFLESSPESAFAKGHLGFILFSEGQYEEALPLLLEGIHNEPSLGTNPKFYLYAGEALSRLRRADEVRWRMSWL